MTAVDTLITQLASAKQSDFSQPLSAQVSAMIAALQQLQGSQQLGALLNLQNLLASGTYVPTAGAVSILIYGIGGGGGGGGAVAAAAATSAGSGGGSGAPMAVLLKGTNVVSTTYTIGAGGAGGDATGSAGSAGGSSSWGALFSATGGNGGLGDASAGITPQVLGGGGGGAVAGNPSGAPNFRAHGSIGNASYRFSGTIGQSGGGAVAGMLISSDGGNPRDTNATPNGFAGQGGGGAGAGGGGALACNATGRAGGAGGDGRFYVLEFGG